MLKIQDQGIIKIALLCFVFMFLNSCATHHHKDGPPDYYVDETKIPNAVPKVEPLSRIGNKPYYTVFGRRYYVMSSSKNYEEQGIASWYGTQFHTHHTSNGERYNMLAMTAAHKSLPLPTYVQVTNLKNHRVIIVKVNDRGPFESNRLIDLSYVAAKKLGMLGHGTAYVDVKAIDPAEYYRHPSWQASNKRSKPARSISHPIHSQPVYASSKPASSGVYLQVGAFRDKAHAQRLKNRLSTMLQMPVQISLSNSLYHVKVGPMKNSAAVNRINKKLKAIGLNGKRELQKKTYAKNESEIENNKSEEQMDLAENTSSSKDESVSEFDIV